MNRLLLAFAFTVACSGLAYGAGRFAPPLSGPKVVAGEVDRDGNAIRGTGYVSRRIARGRYEIDFSPGVLPGCAAMVVTPVGFLTHNSNDYAPSARQDNGCASTFQVLIGIPGAERRFDWGFQFVAVQE